ncbi:hypothetical protein [uncultured Lutibacter sp.]|nr:hypothetical protein [uncultured Lutibacter sp.]
MEILIKNLKKSTNKQPKLKASIQTLIPNFTYKNKKGELVETNFESPI